MLMKSVTFGFNFSFDFSSSVILFAYSYTSLAKLFTVYTSSFMVALGEFNGEIGLNTGASWGLGYCYGFCFCFLPPFTGLIRSSGPLSSEELLLIYHVPSFCSLVGVKDFTGVFDSSWLSV